MSNNKPNALIVAVSGNGVIGHQNGLPWGHLPRDLQYFKDITNGCPIIMGRKTHESIGRLLPNRLNIIVTRNSQYTVDGAVVVHSLSDALRIANEQAPLAKANYVIGGAVIFKEVLEKDYIDTLYISRIRCELEGDTLLPEIAWQEWQKITSTHYPPDDDNAYAIDFEIYSKLK